MHPTIARPAFARLATATATATATALLVLAFSSSAIAQAPAKQDQTQDFKAALDKGLAMAMLPMQQLIVEGCRKVAPGQSQGVEADWAKRMANPELKAHTQTAEYAQGLAEGRPILEADLAKPGGAKEWAPKCKAGLQ